MTGRRQLLLLAVLFAPLCAGCGLARSTSIPENGTATTPPQASPGERQGTVPPGAESETGPLHPAASPRQALERYATTYINWTYASLSAVQTQLAASSVGEARAQELQARAQTATDRVLARARIFNTGRVVAVAPVHDGPFGEWIVDTRERTGGGDQEYAATREGFHVALATVQRVPGGGFAVSSWRPQV